MYNLKDNIFKEFLDLFRFYWPIVWREEVIHIIPGISYKIKGLVLFIFFNTPNYTPFYYFLCYILSVVLDKAIL